MVDYERDFGKIVGLYAAVILFVLGFWGCVLYSAYRLVVWLAAG